MLPLPGCSTFLRGKKTKENNEILCPTLLIYSLFVVHLNGVSQSWMASRLNRQAGLAFPGRIIPLPQSLRVIEPSEQSPMCPERGRWEALLGRRDLPPPAP